MRIMCYHHMQIADYPHNRKGVIMQIREQGRKLQCIRTVYDKEKGRGRQLTVASIPRWGASPPSDADLALLTEAEREQLAKFLAQRRAEVEASNSRYTAMSAASWLPTLAKSIGEGHQLTPEQATAIWQGMAEVAKSLRKAGYVKPKAPRKAKAQQPEAATVEPDAVAAKTDKPKPPRKPRQRKTAAPGNAE